MAETDRPDPPPADPAESWPHDRYQKKITLVAGVCAGVGAAIGAGLLVFVLTRKAESVSLRAVLAPLSFGFGGYMFGMAVMCLFAPSQFLTGPVGRPWMKMIGTKSVLVARIVCGIFGLIGVAVAVGLGFLFFMMATGK